MTELEKANMYMKEKKQQTKERYRPKYHLSPPVGWMNDPNGFVQYQQQYHVFYQYYPYDTKWGPMHWGHAVSKDLLHWRREAIALCPDKPYDDELGCFSGSALEKDGELYIMYTGVSHNQQTQNIAILKEDGTFRKYAGNPVIDERNLPQDFLIQNSRDPNMIEINGIYYVVIGSRRKDDGSALLLFKSSDLLHWEYVNVIYTLKLPNKGIMECPNILRIDDQDVIIYSPQFENTEGEKANKNIHSVKYVIGKMDYQKGLFTSHDAPRELDLGFDFYATQTMKNEKGQVLLMAWANMWDRTYPSARDGWVGALSLPRVLSIRHDSLIQTPIDMSSIIKEVIHEGNLKREEKTHSLPNDNPCFELSLDVVDAQDFLIRLAKDGEEETRFSYEKENHTFVLDRSKSGQVILNQDGSISAIRKGKYRKTEGTFTLRIIVDVSIIEIFIDDGELTFTGNIYKERPRYDIELCAENMDIFKNVKLKKYEQKGGFNE